jgi:hypothetical protein
LENVCDGVDGDDSDDRREGARREQDIRNSEDAKKLSRTRAIDGGWKLLIALGYLLTILTYGIAERNREILERMWPRAMPTVTTGPKS